MRGKTLAVTFATALLVTAALPPAAAGDYGGGYIKTVQRASATERREDRAEGLIQVDRRGQGHHKGRGHHRGGRYHGHHHGHHRRPVYIVPRYRFYGGPYRHHHHHYYGDYLGMFLLGGLLGYHLND